MITPIITPMFIQNSNTVMDVKTYISMWIVLSICYIVFVVKNKTFNPMDDGYFGLLSILSIGFLSYTLMIIFIIMTLSVRFIIGGM